MKYVLVSLFCLYLTSVACAQGDTTVFRIDSLPAQGVTLDKGWKFHAGDNPAWASPDIDDSRWDSLRPTRSIGRLTAIKQAGQGWLRLTFGLDSSVAQSAILMTVNQTGASEMYIDGRLYQRLGRVGADYQHQKAFMPIGWDSYPLSPLSAGRHVMAVRISQHQPPWYVPKLLYASQSVFRVTLFPVTTYTRSLVGQVYAQTLGNYLLVGIFLMLSAIHFMYYRYRRKRINLVFGLTLLFGAAAVVLTEFIGLVNSTMMGDWLYMLQGLLIASFMFMLLVTYYVYLSRPVSWLLSAIAVLLIAYRLGAHLIGPSTVTGLLSMISTIALFADGIRVSINGIRSHRPNARFMLNSIIIMVLILVVGGVVSWFLSTRYPVYSGYAYAATNVLFFLTLPISFAIILAREYAQTSRSLEDRLIEVEQLSAEKETILTQQNATLERQVADRTAELQQSLDHLRTTQTQLIQAEKMASLGELTAGIAHEIQNPLNFVNNFAEVSAELVDELQQEQQKPNRDSDLEVELLGDLKQNLQKITQHGNRASSIVKGMLEHSRTSTGKRQSTDLNALCDEYLRLAYQGLRAKDKAFNCELVTHLDPGLPQIEVVPQEMGRVLLNLYNNAFYAVEQKQKTAPSDYRPTVTVSTHLIPQHVPEGDTSLARPIGLEIRVRDNGTGIPESVKAKIFQPFFTTKPTGEGTGLGLSLSYDIITKGHGGILTVVSKEGEGTEFIIGLPADK